MSSRGEVTVSQAEMTNHNNRVYYEAYKTWCAQFSAYACQLRHSQQITHVRFRGRPRRQKQTPRAEANRTRAESASILYPVYNVSVDELCVKKVLHVDKH